MAEGKDFPRAGDVFANRYRVERILGACRNSIVYGARHRITGQSVAIRWWHSEACSFSGSKAFSPSALHPVESDDDSSSSFVAMEWPEGKSLKALLQREGPLSLRDIGRLLVPCMRRMHELHREGVLHLDLRTAKILVCRSARVNEELLQIVDFDIADRWMTDARFDSPAATSRDSCAPEQLAKHTADHRTDVYAFGAILHECITGTPAAAATTSATGTAIVVRRDAAQRISADSLPVGLAPIIERAMAHEPGDRFETLEAFADALEAYLRAPSGMFSPRRWSTGAQHRPVDSASDSLAYPAQWNTVRTDPARPRARAWRRWWLMGALCLFGVAVWFAT